MKMLYVYGDDDYGALTFSDLLGLDNPTDLARIWKESMDKGEAVNISGTAEDEDGEEVEYDITCEAYEFGPVDSKFIDWIRDSEILDYDDSKNRNFFVIEE